MGAWYWKIRLWCETVPKLEELPTHFIEPLAKEIERELDAQQAAKLEDRRCPACRAMIEKHSVYCDNCGTDTPLKR